MDSRKYTKEEVEEAVKKSNCYADVFRNLNIVVNGGSYPWIKKLIKSYNISTSHFLNSKTLFNLNRSSKRINYQGVTELKSPQRLRSRKLTQFLSQNNVPYRCNRCNLTKWEDSLITLDVDHINENCLDNRLENLQFLCPNCHRIKTIDKTD